MDKTHKETPTECPDCKCTNLVSDQCKGECLCHHPELTQTDEWENAEREIRYAGSNLLDEVLEERYGMQKHHPPEDIPQWFVDVIRSILTSHDAELRRKIEGTLLTILVRSGDRKTLDEYIRRDAVLALLGKKNV